MDEYSNTIVGGRDGIRATRQNHPRGIEILLKKAKADPVFRDRLLNDPVDAAVSIRLELCDSERTILNHIPRDALNIQVENTRIPARLTPVYRTARTAASLLSIVAFSALTPHVSATAGEMEAPLEMDDAFGVAVEQMYLIQEALEVFYAETGSYPTTNQWRRSATNPFLSYVDPGLMYDPWYNLFDYEGISEEGVVVNYRLQSRGRAFDSPEDNIPCPIDPAKHSFLPVINGSFHRPVATPETLVAFAAGTDPVFLLVAELETEATLTWYLDGEDIGTTFTKHFVEAQLSPGEHLLRVMDAQGRSAATVFTTPTLDDVENARGGPR